jgi:hypothetical protein
VFVLVVLFQDQCAWALGNIAGDSVECRKILHDQGCLPPLVRLLEVSERVNIILYIGHFAT